MTRCVPVNLFFEGDPSRRKFRMADAEGYAEEHRPELLAELLGMVERWKGAGKPLANVKTRFNKRGWGNIIGGILAVNGEPDFLANVEDAAHELDPTYRDVSELVSLMAHAPGTKWSSSELSALALGKRLLGSDLGDGSAKSQATRMGIILSRYVNAAFEISGTVEATLYRDDDGDKTVYGVKLAMRATRESGEIQNDLF